jgi:hypothetical protein
LSSVEIQQTLQRELGIRLPQTALMDFATPEALIAQLAKIACSRAGDTKGPQDAAFAEERAA